MNNHFITKLVKFCLYGLMAACLMTILSNLAQINLMNDFFVDYLYSQDTYDILIEKNDDRVLLIGGVYGILLLSSFPIIGRWFYVSAKINHLSEVKDLEITPGWAVGWYFIPFANLCIKRNLSSIL
jgi:hypothetical protein